MAKKIKYGPMMIHEDVKLAEEVLNNCFPHRIVREKGITYKFYSYNHNIIRLDFTNRCSVLKNIKVC